MQGEIPSPEAVRLQEFERNTVDVLTWLGQIYEHEELGPLLDNTVVPLEPGALMNTYSAMEGAGDEDAEDSSFDSTWENDDPRHFQDLSADEQRILLTHACQIFGTTREEMEQNEVDPSEVNVVNPDTIEEGAAEQYADEKAPTLSEEHYYKTGKEGTYMSQYVYSDGSVVWGIARSTS